MEEQEKPGRSGKQIGDGYAEKFRGYLDGLRARKERLPARNGRPNNSAIALACEFPRLTLYANPQVRAMLKAAVEDQEIGIGGSGESPPNPDGDGVAPRGRTAHLEKLASRYEKRIGELEEIRATQAAEIEELKRERRGLRERLRQYEVIEEIMTTSGRRFRP